MRNGVSQVSVKEDAVEYQGPGKGAETSRLIPCKRLFSLKEAAVYLGKGLYGIRELVWCGKLPIVRDGRKQMIDREDLDRYIQARKGSYFLREADERVINGQRK